MATSALDGVVGQERGGGSSTANSWNRGRDFFSPGLPSGVFWSHTGKEGGKDRIFLAGAKGGERTPLPGPDGLAAELLNYEY